MIETYNKVLSVLQEMGYMIFEEAGDDFAISDYIIDSLIFIEFIVMLEEKLNVELSDEFLQYELLDSAYGLASKIDSYISEI